MASYIEQVLGRDENIVATAKITGWIYFGPALLTVCTLGLLCPVLLIPYIQRATTDLGVTNKRVIAKSGLISRRTVEQRIQKIESIRVSQGIIGRMLDYGTIMVHGTGGATTPIRSVADPFAFKRAVESVIDDYESTTK
ncbi:MAG TPA: PH domain-containing protein [Mycobacterium sp.]|nr:PH domain-containing protein [Mycobacterium sp.]